MVDYVATRYDLATGAIGGTISGSLSDFLRDVDTRTQNVIEGTWNSDEFYVVGGKATPRPILDLPGELQVRVGATLSFQLPGTAKVSACKLLGADGAHVPRTADGKYQDVPVGNDRVAAWSVPSAGLFELSIVPDFPLRLHHIRIVAEPRDD